MNYSKITDGVVIIFDKSSLESFIAAEQIVETIKTVTNKNIFTIVAGNKSDLLPVVSTDEVIETALRLNFIYLEVSATKNENIKTLFDLIILKVLENNI